MRRRSWLQKRLDHIREGFYHPWALLTATNRRREILMVDVLTEEGSLYSGKLTSWIPEQQGISAISMEYSLRYYPLSSEESKGEALPKVVNEKAKSSQAPVLSESKRRERKKDLVKNHGEMVIPSSQILTYHFWEIRRHFSCTIPIEKDSDLEVVKWYFLIAFVHDGFFDRITLQFGVERDKLISLLQKLRKWMNDNGIALPEKLVETQVESKAAPSTNASSKKKT